MKKLKLESIVVTSFETSHEQPGKAGTVRGNQQVAVAPASYPFACPTDPQMDCTYGCSHFTACPDGCVRLSNELVCA
jgi:hypothetical protein